MLYLKKGEQISAEAIAKSFDDRSEVETGYIDGQLVFCVTVWGGAVGFIAPPLNGSGVWGVNLAQGARELSGYYREAMISFQDENGEWDEELDLLYFAPLSL